MSEPVWIDAIEVGRRIGVPEETFLPPVPGATHKVTVQSWNGDFLKKGIAEISPLKAKGGTVVVSGHVDAWIILALGNSLKPECDVMYGAGLYGPGHDPVATPLITLPMGRLNPDLYFRYSVRTEGDNWYMDYRVDDPNPPLGSPHTFDNDQLPNLVLPVIPADKHLYLYAVGCYYVQVNVTNSYSKYALTVSTSYHDDKVYHCAYSSVPEMKPGDETPRLKESGV